MASTTADCYLCTGSSPFLEPRDLVSVGFLKECHAALIALGKRARIIDYQNVKTKVLLKFEDRILTINIFSIPTLQLLSLFIHLQGLGKGSLQKVEPLFL